MSEFRGPQEIIEQLMKELGWSHDKATEWLDEKILSGELPLYGQLDDGHRIKIPHKEVLEAIGEALEALDEDEDE